MISPAIPSPLITRTSTHGFPNEWAGFQALGLKGGSFCGISFDSYYYVQKLERGAFVSAGEFNTRQRDQLSGFGELAGEVSGYFIRRGIGFVGFAFDGGAGKQYGWARVFMNGYQQGNGFKILDYAYADPGEAIRAGQTSSDAQGRPRWVRSACLRQEPLALSSGASGGWVTGRETS